MKAVGSGHEAKDITADQSPTHNSLVFPEAMPVERWIAAGLFVASCAYLCAFVRYMPLDQDEGIVLQGAERILRGQVLYRDFFSFFTPGSYYLAALLFKSFGNSLIVARAALVIYGGFFTVFTYWMTRRVCARWIALMVADFAMVACLPWRFMVLHNWDSTLWLCLAVYCAVLVVQTRHAGWAFGLGSFVCFTFLFEQSKGAGLMIGLLVGFCILARMQPHLGLWSRANGSALLAGLAWPLTLTIGYFAAHHALAPLIADWTWPLHHYSTVNQVPYGWADWSDQTRNNLFGSGDRVQTIVAAVAVAPCFIFPALPIVGLFLLVRSLISVRRGRMAPDRACYYCVVGSSVGGALLSVVAVRMNIVHFVYLAPLLYLVLAWIIDGRDIFPGIAGVVQPVAVAIAFVTFTSAGLALLVANREARFVLETRRGVVRTPAPDELLPFIQAHVPANEKIFVYPYFTLGYYLTATFSATRYEYLQPGMHTRGQDREAIREIDANRTAVVLFESSFYDKIVTSWPNTPVSTFADDPVADYIFEHYHSCATLALGNESQTIGGPSRFSFMLRDGLPCPGNAAMARSEN